MISFCETFPQQIGPAWRSATVLNSSRVSPHFGHLYVYNGKLIALLMLKIPRWTLIYVVPALLTLMAWHAEVRYWYFVPVLTVPLFYWSVWDDPYEGPILRFPIATYLKPRRRQRQGQVEHESGRPPQGPSR